MGKSRKKKMMKEKIEAIVIFRTGQLFEIDMAVDVLKEKNIPHYTQEETSSGLKLAMPVAPATGPGVWWTLLVPRQHLDEATEALEGLPFCQGTDPGVWGFKPRAKVKLGWKIYAVIAVSLPVLFWLQEKLSK